MAKVQYKQGTKATYLGLTNRSSTALYFCTDTKELFKGDDIYSDGLRIVDNYANLPTFKVAADGILYFCTDSGSGYLLNETRDGWLPVVHGVDNNTIEYNSSGLMAVKAVPITAVTGLAERLQAVEQGANSQHALYEIHQKPIGTLVDYSEYEIRVMCPIDTEWEYQNITGQDANVCYLELRAYAPNDDIWGYKDNFGEVITETTMSYFEDNSEAGVDDNGRKYCVAWVPAAVYDADSNSWSYYGTNSSAEKFIGWYYSIEWFNADGRKVAADTIRINLSNEQCHTYHAPYFTGEIQAMLSDIAESYYWIDM